MKTLKVYTVVGIIFVSVLGSALHFAYSRSGNNPIVGIFALTDESTWEHMKLFFFPMFFYSIFANRKLKADYPCITSALYFGILLGTFLIPVIFYTYSGILGYNVAWIDISTFFISTAVAFLTVNRLAQSCKAEKYKPLLFSLVYITFFAFILFTFYPPTLGIFQSP